MFFRHSVSQGTIAATSTWVLTADPTVILASDQIYYTKKWNYVTHSYTDGVPTPCRRAYYLDGIRAHEAGHSIGLAHSGEPDATMYASASTCDAGLVSLHLDDEAGRDALYGAAADVTDIAITDVSAPSAAVQGDMVSVDVTVENVGNQDVPGTITVWLNDDDGTGSTLVGNEDIVGGLSPGASTVVNFMWDTTSAAIVVHTLEASHNTTDDVDTNDSGSAPVDVQDATIDIAITNVVAPSSTTAGDTVSVDVTVQNLGNQDVTSDIIVSLSESPDGTGFPTQTIAGGLVAGASRARCCSFRSAGCTRSSPPVPAFLSLTTSCIGAASRGGGSATS